MTNAMVYLLGGAIGAALLGWAFGWVFAFVRELLNGAKNSFGD